MSREMWEFDENGYMRFEKVSYGFLPSLFQKWNEVRTTHICSIVLFARIHYKKEAPDRSQCKRTGIWYKDFYKVVLDWESRPCNWMSTLELIREEIHSFKQYIFERHSGEYVGITGKNSSARDGNILEAANLALNAFDRHYIDRDLQRTGLSIVVITPSTAVFNVDKKLLRITTERMYDDGIALDIVSLARLPLHTSPIFHFCSCVSKFQKEEDLHAGAKAVSSNKIPRSNVSSVNFTSKQLLYAEQFDPLYEDIKCTDPDKTTEKEFYGLPHWVVTSIYNFDGYRDPFFRKLASEGSFYPRCRIPDVQSMAITELDMVLSEIPYLPNLAEIDGKVVEPFGKSEYEAYDESIFKTLADLHSQLFSSEKSPSCDRKDVVGATHVKKNVYHTSMHYSQSASQQYSTYDDYSRSPVAISSSNYKPFGGRNYSVDDNDDVDTRISEKEYLSMNEKGQSFHYKQSKKLTITESQKMLSQFLLEIGRVHKEAQCF